MRDETRRRVLEEIQRCHNEIANCAHCEALRGQMARLSILLPPDPISIHDLATYVFTPSPKYLALVERRAAELLRDLKFDGDCLTPPVEHAPER